MNISSCLLAVSEFEGVFALSIPILGILIGPAIVYIVFRSKRERERLWHETARLAIEKGQPLPPLPADLASDDGVHARSNADIKSMPRGFRDLRTGLILIGIGVGLYFGVRDFNKYSAIAPFVLFGIGAARTISGVVAMSRSKDKSSE